MKPFPSSDRGTFHNTDGGPFLKNMLLGFLRVWGTESRSISELGGCAL